jgi:hypothetical protein
MEFGETVAYRFAVDQEGEVRMVGEQRPGQAEPQRLDPAPLVYVEPMTAGRTWESDSTTTVAVPGTRVVTKATVESDDDTVEVPAGRFERCARIVSRGEARIETETGPATVAVETRLWYAPGVGVVKIERNETTDREDLRGSSLTYKLLSFDRG